MLPAIILAAGASSRMGSPKALLAAPDGRPFVARIVRALLAADVTRIVVVTGRDHDAIVSAVIGDQPSTLPIFARNDDPGRGQLSSLWVGMDAVLTADAEGVMMTLVDVPMLDAVTIGRVIDAWRATRAPIVRPAIGDRHGHPVIFDRALFGALRAASLEQGAKAVVRAHADAILNVLVSEEGSLIDVDTPADYDELGRRSE